MAKIITKLNKKIHRNCIYGLEDEYSTTKEIETKKKYNGKTVYRKCIDLGTLTGTTATKTNTGIVNADKIISFYGTAMLENQYGINLPSNGDAVSGVVFRARLNSTLSEITTERSSNSFYQTKFVVEYTKK